MHSAFGTLDVPATFCNSMLNGSEALVLRWWPHVLLVLLLTGPCAGREWHVKPEHIRFTGRRRPAPTEADE